MASLHPVDGVVLLRPEDQVFEGMLSVFANQHASTTSIYTCVSSDFRTRTLRRHLDATVAAALAAQAGRQA